MRSGIISGVVFAAVCRLATAQSLEGPLFEVASVKPFVASAAPSGAPQFLPSGRFIAPRITLRELVLLSYGLNDFQLAGGPNWFKSDLFAVEAKAAQPASDEQMKTMLGALIEQRFHLKVHRESREIATYSLTAEGSAPKIQTAQEAAGVRPGFMVASGSMTARRVTFAILAKALSRMLDRPVLDKTGFSGVYDFKLEYDQSSLKQPILGLVNGPDEPAASIYTAVRETLGLRLIPVKEAVDVTVFDSATRPTAN